MICKQVMREIKYFLEAPWLKRAGAYNQKEINALVKHLRVHGERVNLKGIYRLVKRDPADDVFVSLAISGDADYIVSNDKHLLELNRIKGVQVIRPDELVLLIDKPNGNQDEIYT